MWAPLADFFGNGFGDARFESLYVGMTDDGYYCNLPMPFARGARLEIENGSRLPLKVEGEVRWRRTARPRPGRRAVLHPVAGMRSRPRGSCTRSST